MNAVKILALLGALNAASASAQPAPSFVVINNTNQLLFCASRMPNGQWTDFFPMNPAANWKGSSPNPQIEFQCRPPVAQVRYTLDSGHTYSLLQSSAEVTLVQTS